MNRPAVLLLLLLCACGLPDAFEHPGAGELEQPFPVAAPAPPMPPAAVQMGPCPMGWRALEADPLICEPWPAGGMASCSGDSAHFPGEPGCARVGEACAADGWPTQLPAGRTAVFVRAGATPGGTGTRTSPFATLAEALAGGGGGKVIALGPGAYEPPGPLPANTALFGACVAQTTLTITAGASPAIVYATAPGIEVHQVRVSGPAVGLAVAGATAQLTARDVIVESATGVGVLMQMGGHLTGTNVVVRATQKRADGTLGEGVHVVDGAVLHLTRAVVANNSNAGVFIYNAGADVTLEQAAVAGNADTGVWVNQLGAAHLKATTVDGNRSSGVNVAPRASADLTDVIVRGTAPAAAGTGQNIWVDGAQLTARRLRVEDCNALGVGVNNAASVTIDDLVSQRDKGVGGNAGAQVTVHRALMRHSIGEAFTSRLTGTLLTVSDATVVDPDFAPGMLSGGGINIIRGGGMVVSRMRVTRGKGGAVSVTSPGSTLVATDLLVEDTLPGSDGEAGFPLGVSSGASLTLERALLAGGYTAGLYVLMPGSSATLTDVEIRDIAPPASQLGLYGNGLEVTDSATIRGTRVRLFNDRDTALLADGPGSSMELSDVSIIGTELTCVGNPDCLNRVPVGLSSQNGAAVKLSRFLVASNVGIGVQVADTAQLDLSDGEVSFHQLGANVLPAGYDVQRLNQNVTYRHDEQNLAAQSVPLPKVAPPPPAM